MAEREKFVVSKLSEAAFLEGCCNAKCTQLICDPNNAARMLFIFDLSIEEGEELVARFGSSEAFKFDNSCKYLKSKLFQKLRGKDR